MTDKTAWSGASGSQGLQQGHEAHVTLAGAKITEVQETVQSVPDSLSSVLKSAEQCPEFVDFILPLGEVVKQLTEWVGSETLQPLRNCIAALVRILQKFEADKKLQAAEFVALKQDLQQYKADIVAVEQELQRLRGDRRKVMLGQLAYTLDKVACEFVFGLVCEFMTLNDLVEFAKAGDLTDEDAKRFKEFCTIIKDKCDIDRLIRLLAPLRAVRREPAHGYAEEITSVTPEQLRAWACEFKLPSFVLSGVLPVLELFTELERPLVLRQNASCSRAVDRAGLHDGPRCQGGGGATCPSRAT